MVMATTDVRPLPVDGEVSVAKVKAPQVNGTTENTNGHHDDCSASKDVLHVTDGRTGTSYDILITHNSVRALDFKTIKVPNSGDIADRADNVEGGLRLLDPGFQNTAVKESKITYVNGQKGEIQYRGHPIETLVGVKHYEDVIYLLIWGHLPTEPETINFSMSLATFPLPPSTVFDVIRAFPPESPPIPMIISGLSALAASQPETIPAYTAKNIYMGNRVAVHHQIIRSIASIASISAAVYCHKLGRQFTPPQPHLSYVENVLLMMGHVDKETGMPDRKHVSYLQRLWVLTADHEMTSSTAAFLHTASSLNDPIMSLVSGMGSSWGILHGGAIEVAYKDIQRVGSVTAVHEKINAVKAGKMRLFGYGHRIYKVTDPRYVFIHEMLDELQTDVTDDAILAVALEIDRVASTDEYFTSRKIKANADLFASFVYKALGFPADFILPLSSISRVPGLMAHWQEAMSEKPCIWRPQQIYTGDLAV